MRTPFESLESRAGERLDPQKVEAPEAAERNVEQPESADTPENGARLDAARRVKDDAGNDVCEGARLRPNDTFIKYGIEHKTDDNCRIYSVDRHLLPNFTYKLHGAIYKTDALGRIVHVEATPVRCPENARDLDAQREAGGDDRRPDDQGGHILGRDLGGDAGNGNLIAMNPKINQSDYKRMENDIKTALDAGKDVTMKADIHYLGSKTRPDRITVTVTADGKSTVYKFDNNIDGALRSELPADIQKEMDTNGGEVSSVKEVYDETGSLVEATACVTGTDENGSTSRSWMSWRNKHDASIHE